jgi:hypothetical protein
MQASGPPDLCQELLSYAEEKVAAPTDAAAARKSGPAVVSPPRVDGQATGTQGGGSVDPNVSLSKVPEPPAPPIVPVAPGAAPEPAVSPHATDPSDDDALFKLAGGTTLQQVRDAARTGDRQTCRDITQALRRAGADLPAWLIALAAYEPDPAKRR